MRFSDALDDTLDWTPRSARTGSRSSSRSQRIRLICDAADAGHRLRPDLGGLVPRGRSRSRTCCCTGNRVILDAARFAQLGTLERRRSRVGRHRHRRRPRHLGRLAGPVLGHPAGRRSRAARAGRPRSRWSGFWWLYVPMRFDDYAIIVIVQEDAGRLPHPQRRDAGSSPTVASSSSAGRGSRSTTVSGTRIPSVPGCISSRPDGEPLVVEVDALTARRRCTSAAATAATPTGRTASGWGATGRGADRTTSPIRRSSARTPWGVIDHVGRATCNGGVGWGLFEHASLGRHDPTGFADWLSVAP